MNKREYQLADYQREQAMADAAPDRSCVPVSEEYMRYVGKGDQPDTDNAAEILAYVKQREADFREAVSGITAIIGMVCDGIKAMGQHSAYKKLTETDRDLVDTILRLAMKQMRREADNPPPVKIPYWLKQDIDQNIDNLPTVKDVLPSMVGPQRAAPKSPNAVQAEALQTKQHWANDSW